MLAPVPAETTEAALPGWRSGRAAPRRWSPTGPQAEREWRGGPRRRDRRGPPARRGPRARAARPL